MIERLSIRNLALLESAELNLDDTLTVFTGETGAGKSLLISALDLVSGGRASKDVVRNGSTSALVEVVFSAVAQLLPPAIQAELIADGLVELDPGEDFPDSLILSREVAVKGKNFCRINGRFVSLQRLHEVGAHLLDIQSQRDQATLYDVKTHLPLLDRFAGVELQEKLKNYQIFLSERKQLLREQKQLGGNPAQRARELDLLMYQITEIDKLAPRSDEDEKLRKHRLLYQNSAKIRQAVDESILMMSADTEDSLLVRLDLISARLQEVARLDERWRDQAERVNLLREELSDLTSDLNSQRDAIEDRPELLEKIELRLNQLADLKRKYGPELRDVADFKSKAEARRAELEAAESRLVEIDEQLRINRLVLQEAAKSLTEVRRAAAEHLSTAIENELSSLGMKEAKFNIEFAENEMAYGPSGLDQVQFMICTNPGEEFKALVKIASGGEAARILLAIKLILTSGHPNATLIFDEVDSGVSGQTCTLIGEKLLRLAVQNQVFCVTHSAQIAACGQAHVLIAKSVSEGRTHTQLLALKDAERKHELARLLSGEEAAGAAAEVVDGLLERARQFNQSLLQ